MKTPVTARKKVHVVVAIECFMVELVARCTSLAMIIIALAWSRTVIFEDFCCEDGGFRKHYFRKRTMSNPM